MNVKHLASSVAALAILALASGSEPVEARGHGGHGVHGGHSMRGVGWAPHFSSVHSISRPHHVVVHRFRHHRRFVVVGGYPYYADGCYWLRRRALYTGSPYWWRRYYACLNGYY